MCANYDQFIGFFMLMHKVWINKKVCTINSWTEDGSIWQVISHTFYLKNDLCYRHAERRIEHYLYFKAAHPGMFYSWNTVNVRRGALILSNSLLVFLFVTFRFRLFLFFVFLCTFQFNLVHTSLSCQTC